VRSVWSDVLIDAAVALRADRTLQLLLAPLQDVSQTVAGGGTFDWQTAELALHCVRCGVSVSFGWGGVGGWMGDEAYPITVANWLQ